MGVPNRNDGKIERADLDAVTARQSFLRAPHTRRSRSISIARIESFYWSDREACASCARISTARTSKRSWKPAAAMPTAAIRRTGVWVLRSTRIAGTSTGRKRAGQRRAGRHLPRESRYSCGAERLPTGGHYRPVRRAAGADRPGARSEKSPFVLDRPRRSAARNT